MKLTLINGSLKERHGNEEHDYILKKMVFITVD
jgi:hypothetical protein